MPGDARRIVEAGYDAIARRYAAWARATDDPGRERYLERFEALLPDGSRVLDLGCGAGLPSTRRLAERFAVTGVDLSREQLDAARRNVPTADFVHGDLATVALPDAHWHGAVALYALTHVPREEHAAVFARIARWLVPGGVFLATLAGRDSPDWTGEWLGRPMFFSGHGPAASRALLVEAGFELLADEIVETHEPEGPVPFHWVLARTPSRTA